MTEALVISKRLKFSQDDRTDINFIGCLECISKDLKVLSIVFKKVAMVSMRLGGNRCWVPLFTDVVPSLIASYFLLNEWYQ